MQMATETYSFHISSRLSEDCVRIVTEQGFDNFSDLFTYAIRNYRDRILRHEVTEIKHLPCPKDISKRVRIRRSMLEEIAHITGLRVSEVPEYALRDFIDEWTSHIVDVDDFEPEW